jgi:hypothetical protein
LSEHLLGADQEAASLVVTRKVVVA